MIDFDVGPRVSIVRPLLQVKRVVLVGLCRRAPNDAIEHHRVVLYARTVVVVVMVVVRREHQEIRVLDQGSGSSSDGGWFVSRKNIFYVGKLKRMLVPERIQRSLSNLSIMVHWLGQRTT